MRSIRGRAGRGAPLERGREYGRLAARRIGRGLAAYRDVFQHRVGLEWDAAVAHARSFLPAVEAFAPESLQEMLGIAHGANVPFDAILALNCRSELMFAAAHRKGDTPPSECTSFAATSAVSDEGHMLLGQNWDWVPFARELSVLLEVQRADAPSFA